jgi:glycosyltransferase involved in cell wall biosynthesis
MRIALVVPHPASDGTAAEERIFNAAAALGATGASVDVFCGRLAAGPPERLADGMTVHAIDHRRPRVRAPRTIRYDVVHAFGLTGLRIATAIGAAEHHVFSPHGDRWLEPAGAHGLHRTRPRLGALLTNAVDSVICRSQLEATRVRRHAPEVSDRLHVVRAGVDVEALRAAEPLPNTRAVILALGPLDRGGRAIRVVGALAGLDERFVLVVLGDGPARRRMCSVVDVLTLGDRVRFVRDTTLEARRRWMVTAAVLVPMSGYEDVETLALEAAAIETPLVVPDCAEQAGGLGYESGAVVRVISGPSSPLAIADAIRETAVRHRPAPSRAGVRSWEDHARDLLAVYRRVHRLPDIATRRLTDLTVEQHFRSGQM